MKKVLMLALLGLLVLSACGTGEEVEARNAWARAAAQGENSAVYLLLHNHTAEDDELLSASTDAAEIVELHESRMVAGTDMMEMVPQDSIPLPAGGKAELKPGGLHIMLIGLTRDLNVGDEISLILTFKSGLTLTLSVPVEEGMPAMEGMNH
ncbi:MAG: copper chaperone PCu(A)C [Chloroflexota bacterium]